MKSNRDNIIAGLRERLAKGPDSLLVAALDLIEANGGVPAAKPETVTVTKVELIAVLRELVKEGYCEGEESSGYDWFDAMSEVIDAVERALPEDYSIETPRTGFYSVPWIPDYLACVRRWAERTERELLFASSGGQQGEDPDSDIPF